MIAALAKIVALARFVWLLAVVNAWTDFLQPGIDHVELAAKIAYVAIASPIVDPVIDTDSRGSAAELTTEAKDESSLGLRKIGDHGKSFGLVNAWMRPDLLNDDLGNLLEGARQARVSHAMQPECPWCAWFTGHVSHDRHVVYLSDRRVRETKELLHLWDESAATVMR